jgi:hypothetical protein
MAHTCPDCGSACYCSGDIDDIFMEGTEEEIGCVHCLHGDTREDDCEDFEEAPNE